MSTVSDEAFMRRPGMVVQPMSNIALRDLAERVRTRFLKDDQVAFPIIELLEFKLQEALTDFVFDVREVEEMGELEGLVIGGRPMLCLRRDVYDRACLGSGRDRFTASHELAHYLLHRNVQMARIRDQSFKVYYDSEWQADRFAGALMMSRRHLHLFKDAEHAAELCGMSLKAAKYQLALHGRNDAKR